MATYTDALNRSINLEQPAARIVSLVPSITEALFTFGLNEAIVGVTRYCVEPAAGVAEKAKVGGTKMLDVRSVLDLQPDLVIANAEENRQEDIRQLLAAGQRVFVTFPRTVASAVQMLRQLAQMTGSTEAATPILDEAEAALAEARQANHSRPRLRVFCPIWRRPWMTVGPNTYMHDFIAACGGFNVFSERHERYPKAELDEVARRVPQVILLPNEPYPFAPKHIGELTEYKYVPAVRDKRIYLLDGKHLCWYGPRIAGSLRYVQGLLWGDAANPKVDGVPATGL
ncbi:MAG: cobalamin-binding protein [Chloroflexi bacterium]|nr:MAG: cobalamin-binding protein [Chloroflexota bacterium]